LYASQSIVLPFEIAHAADYLSMGGKFQDLHDLADIGIFMENYDLLGYDSKVKLITFINNGGPAGEVYKIINSQEMRQTNGQAKTGSQTLCQY